MEPFARWKLTRDLMRSKKRKALLLNGNGKANGVPNGNGHAVHVDGPEISKREARKMHRSVLRFAEQGWSVIYYTCQWCFGLYVHHNLPTAVLNPVNVWINFPHYPLAGPVKLYYLLQTAFYLHQILIINAEARRKDHWQMMIHHVITVALMAGSYFYNYTRVGCLIMILMDWCDIILPLAKMFRYLSMSTLCDATFVIFLLSWLVTRHGLFILAIMATWEVWSHACHASGHPIDVVLDDLSSCMAVVSGKGAEDERSDDEGDGDSAVESKKDQ
ncbi:Sphingosine N-acyltransferase lag1 [Grifola frondosa]|uniref:Sphingosine N-acyltransferase lag1 n=1 Tax=Grifola frondosa TaxID=5627 RepID=A0A1C7MJY0_GRIFR|nr:Sphingosine N-acyltransferase lag1 [Grifola frondosa]